MGEDGVGRRQGGAGTGRAQEVRGTPNGGTLQRHALTKQLEACWHLLCYRSSCTVITQFIQYLNYFQIIVLNAFISIFVWK